MQRALRFGRSHCCKSYDQHRNDYRTERNLRDGTSLIKIGSDRVFRVRVNHEKKDRKSPVIAEPIQVHDRSSEPRVSRRKLVIDSNIAIL